MMSTNLKMLCKDKGKNENILKKQNIWIKILKTDQETLCGI